MHDCVESKESILQHARLMRRDYSYDARLCESKERILQHARLMRLLALVVVTHILLEHLIIDVFSRS